MKSIPAKIRLFQDKIWTAMNAEKKNVFLHGLFLILPSLLKKKYKDKTLLIAIFKHKSKNIWFLECYSAVQRKKKKYSHRNTFTFDEFQMSAVFILILPKPGKKGIYLVGCFFLLVPFKMRLQLG